MTIAGSEESTIRLDIEHLISGCTNSFALDLLQDASATRKLLLRLSKQLWQSSALPDDHLSEK